jgi:hypothetical protein
MFFIVHKCYRRSTLALVLFLAASANCFCVSYDADDDDDVPPVKVEFKFVAPDGKSIGMRHSQAAKNSRAGQPLPSQALLLAGHGQQQPSTIHKASPQLEVPLRR